ncbi:MAG: thioesterase family protein [Hydrogenophaga sp.]|uniref:thioesterase family protein n=1 Tax=Hydrogenophaga sp. TaxID=1904254 RepID=UPI002638B567|nr:thioesterase family protein [Hydrogenophaga sp.]MCV0438909.1 thioesterase family protein [Hydrogenophaga sp.]
MMMAAHEPLLHSGLLTVKPEWIDLYGHMNASRYFSVFVDESFNLMEAIGVGRTHTRESGCGIFVVGAHVQYQSELKQADALRIRMRVLQVDRVRLLVLCEMLDDARNRVAATFEQLTVHVNLTDRKATPLADAKRARIESCARQHASVPLPSGHVRYLQCCAPAARSATHA